MVQVVLIDRRYEVMVEWYQSKNISGNKNVGYEAQLCPIIAKGQRAPNAQLTHQIINRHHEELKSSGPDSQKDSLLINDLTDTILLD
jgi:hypothetical protein